jgi:VanZ family protein
MHKTAAWPLALVYAALIVYASLYPFADWRDQGIMPWAFLIGPITPYRSSFDVAVNVAGYVPFGALVALSALRTGRGRYAVLWTTFLATVLSLVLETLQSYLPVRVPSREDWLMNTLGAFAGASATVLLERLGAIDRWSRIRARWFVPHSRGGLALLATWPLALLFPAAVPFGMGQVLDRLINTLADELSDTTWLRWLPLHEVAMDPLAPAVEVLCVALGLLIPCLLGFCIVRVFLRRVAFVFMISAVGICTTGLSAALSWGPNHSWAWLDGPAETGLLVGMSVSLLLAWVPVRACAGLALLALGVYLSVLNQAPESPYFAQTLQEWEQGRFIRFHGLAQWLGWLWPYATLLYALTQVWRRDARV